MQRHRGRIYGVVCAGLYWPVICLINLENHARFTLACNQSLHCNAYLSHLVHVGEVAKGNTPSGRSGWLNSDQLSGLRSVTTVVTLLHKD